MTKIQALLLFAAGSAAGMTGAALVRELPNSARPTYFTHHFEANAVPLEDGGMTITSAKACVTATISLRDGGFASTDIGCHPGNLSTETAADLRAIKRVMNNSADWGKTAP